jgi:hypothetical protein
MSRLAAFFRKPARDRRLLVEAAVAHLAIALLVRVLPFGRLRQLLDRVAPFGAPRAGEEHEVDPDAHVIRAVRAVSSLLPGATCLTEALIAGLLLRRRHCETTLCFGVARDLSDRRPFDAHAWLEWDRATILGARAIVYDPLASPSRCVPSPLPR